MDGEVTSLVIENRYLTKAGGVIWAKTSISRVPGEGRGPDHFVAQFEDITERKRTGELLEYQASHDALTGLPNRARLCESIEAAIAEEPAPAAARPPCCGSTWTTSRTSTTRSATTTAIASSSS